MVKNFQVFQFGLMNGVRTIPLPKPDTIFMHIGIELNGKKGEFMEKIINAKTKTKADVNENFIPRYSKNKT